jgi:hypothetical protein
LGGTYFDHIFPDVAIIQDSVLNVHRTTLVNQVIYLIFLRTRRKTNVAVLDV